MLNAKIDSWLDPNLKASKNETQMDVTIIYASYACISTVKECLGIDVLSAPHLCTLLTSVVAAIIVPSCLCAS